MRAVHSDGRGRGSWDGAAEDSTLSLGREQAGPLWGLDKALFAFAVKVRTLRKDWGKNPK